jgi:hypothetical protein
MGPEVLRLKSSLIGASMAYLIPRPLPIGHHVLRLLWPMALCTHAWHAAPRLFLTLHIDTPAFRFVYDLHLCSFPTSQGTILSLRVLPHYSLLYPASAILPLRLSLLSASSLVPLVVSTVTCCRRSALPRPCPAASWCCCFWWWSRPCSIAR